MVGILRIHDDFATLALDETLSGRIPPVTDRGANAWVIEGTKYTKGGGSGDVMFESGGAAKFSAHEDLAVKVTWYDGGAANRLWISIRDTQSTAFPRYGYIATFESRAGTAKFFTNNNYTATQVGSDLTVSNYDTTTGINECIFEANGDNLRIIVNDVLVTSFTNSTYPANGSRNKAAVVLEPAASLNGRMQDWKDYDSYLIPGDTPPSVPVVLVW